MAYVYRLEEALKGIRNLNENDFKEGLMIKSKILSQKGDLKQALTISNDLLEANKSDQDWFIELGAIVSKSYALERLGRFLEGLAIIDEAEEIIEGQHEDGSVGIHAAEQDHLGLKAVLHNGQRTADRPILEHLEFQRRTLSVQTAEAAGRHHATTTVKVRR